MTITVSTTDPRSLKALEILETAATWTKGHRKDDGRSFFVIPSCSGHVYWTDQTSCTCPDAVNRGTTCKHQLAVRLWNAKQRAGQPAARAPHADGVWKPCPCGSLIDPATGYCTVCADPLTPPAPSRYLEVFGEE
jgi:hypothetical protein